MNQPIDADEKERIASWNKRCAKVWFKYLAFVVLTFALLLAPFIQVFHYFLDVTVPLVSGELIYGQPGYQEYQTAKDWYLIILAVLLVLFSVVYYLGHRWYKRAIRALGTPPSGMFNRWNRWVVGLSLIHI